MAEKAGLAGKAEKGKLDRGSIRSSPRDGLSTSYRSTKE